MVGFDTSSRVAMTTELVLAIKDASETHHWSFFEGWQEKHAPKPKHCQLVLMNERDADKSSSMILKGGF